MRTINCSVLPQTPEGAFELQLSENFDLCGKSPLGDLGGELQNEIRHLIIYCTYSFVF
jgi:hypothetical protein